MGIQVAHLLRLQPSSLQGPKHGQLSPQACRIRLYQVVRIPGHAA